MEEIRAALMQLCPSPGRTKEATEKQNNHQSVIIMVRRNAFFHD